MSKFERAAEGKATVIELANQVKAHLDELQAVGSTEVATGGSGFSSSTVFASTHTDSTASGIHRGRLPTIREEEEDDQESNKEVSPRK